MKELEFNQIALSFSSGIFLAGLGAASFLFDQVLELSQMSEEIFRGERLPILNPTPRDTNQKSLQITG